MNYHNMYRDLFLAVEKGTIEAVQQASSHIFESAVSITDNAFRVLAADYDPGSKDEMLVRQGDFTYVSSSLLDTFHKHHLIDQLSEQPHKVILVNWDFFQDHPHITTGIFRDGKILGSITVLLRDEHVTAEMEEALLACADACAMVLYLNSIGRRRPGDADRYASLLFHAPVSPETVHAACDRGLLRNDTDYIVIASELAPEPHWERLLLEQNASLVYTEQNTACILAPRTVITDQYTEWVRSRGYHYGISYSCSDLTMTPLLKKQACAALEYGRLSRCKEYCQDFSAESLRILMRRPENRMFEHPAVSKIHQYDLENHTEYLLTLHQWLSCGMDYPRTAARMNLHRNSLYYRINKIQELFSLDLSDANTSVQLYLTILMTNDSPGPEVPPDR